MKTLTIDCKKWVRGERRKEFGLPRLLNQKGNMCCLGFECVQNRGATMTQIREHSLPIDLGRKFGRKVDGKAAEINDDNEIDDFERMRQLRKVFKGRRLRFLNKPKLAGR